MSWFMNAIGEARRIYRAIFIIVISQMYHRIIGLSFRTLRDSVISIEIAMLPICAGDNGKAKAFN
jgi:hypothetical protein